MKRILPLLLAATLLPSAAPAPASRADAWWTDIANIASDDTQGRQTGSPGYLKAADYVMKRFKEIGLAPAGENGKFTQSVAFEQQVIDQAGSSAVLIGPDGKETPFAMGDNFVISAGGARRAPLTDAPMVFLGYGLSLPAFGHDDFAGVDLKGKVAVVFAGGPADIPGPVKAANRNARTKLLAKLGAVGLISLVTPKQMEILWFRSTLLAKQPGMYLADDKLRETPTGWLGASVDPWENSRLFAGSGKRYAEIADLADSNGALPTFPLAQRIRVKPAARVSPVTSPNLVARLDGSDPKLKGEYVVISAHLDHLGVGAAINGDTIYNGAMDDASGVASVLDIAAQLKKGSRPKRTILFVIVTAEEKGLLGSHYFANKPTVPKANIVADLNFDMPLPLWPLKTVLVQGEGESTLGDVARAAAAKQGLALTPDPLPDRNSFVRTDQFSFVKAGVPALSFKFGFQKDTPEFKIEHDWRANRYHSPSDDLLQPGVLKAEAVKLNDYVANVAAMTANAPARPTWLPTSVFNPANAAK
ncbi:M28 family metallopeptidase [Sphingomonas immobilis]|uniref:M28 family metallopeptidase n=1 Tax=Sphingomonas immobilis TaxID=3063997 RepID=A0ABT9A493_9SPHN|nr:M28 family metallopeptidase [Sphingomonas sp. CA1-15]MDO7844649.1 M28 family metallopeptidase [Sphingomonas sp. CA1-15]